MDVWDRIEAVINKPADVSDGIAAGAGVAGRVKYTDAIHVKLMRDGAIIDKSHLRHEMIRKIKNYYTIKDATIMGYDKITTRYKQDHDNLVIPRFGAFLLQKKFQNITYENAIARKNPIEMTYTGEPPTNIQKLLLKEIDKNWINEATLGRGAAGVIINLQAGLGKTYLAMMLMAKWKCRTLIVTHNTTILNQWFALLKQKFPDNSIKKYYGLKKEWGDIVVGVINSLCSETIKDFNSPVDFYDTFDMVIFDECHEYCAPARARLFEVCNAPIMIGLSATPEERADNLHKIIKWSIGPILAAEKLKGYSVEEAPFKGNVNCIKYYGAEEYTKTLINEKLETVSAPLMIEQLTRDPKRTDLIADLVAEFYNKKHNIFVFADRRKYLEEIDNKLKDLKLQGAFLTNDEEMKSVRLMGGSKDDEMKDAIQTKNIILTTYQYMGTGCSIPKMTCIILATPRKSKSRQIINRIFRLGSNYDIVRQIVDIIDWKTPLKNQYYARKKYYDSQNFTYETRVIKST